METPKPEMDSELQDQSISDIEMHKKLSESLEEGRGSGEIGSYLGEFIEKYPSTFNLLCAMIFMEIAVHLNGIDETSTSSRSSKGVSFSVYFLSLFLREIMSVVEPIIPISELINIQEDGIEVIEKEDDSIGFSKDYRKALLVGEDLIDQIEGISNSDLELFLMELGDYHLRRQESGEILFSKDDSLDYLLFLKTEIFRSWYKIILTNYLTIQKDRVFEDISQLETFLLNHYQSIKADPNLTIDCLSTLSPEACQISVTVSTRDRYLEEMINIIQEKRSNKLTPINPQSVSTKPQTGNRLGKSSLSAKSIGQMAYYFRRAGIIPPDLSDAAIAEMLSRLTNKSEQNIRAEMSPSKIKETQERVSDSQSIRKLKEKLKNVIDLIEEDGF